MSLKFRKEIAIDGPLEQVSELLADEDFRRRVAERAGADAIETGRSEHAGGVVEATVDFRQQVDGLPGPLGRVVGSEVHVKQIETWTATDRAKLEVQIPGKPGHIRGTIALRQEGTATIQRVEAEIKVSVPLLGGQIETLLGRILGHVLKVQREVANETFATGS